MNETLRKDWDDIDQLLSQTLQEASRWLHNVDQRSAAGATSTRPMLSLPTAGLGAHAMMEQLMDRYAAGFSSSPGPRYWAFVTGGTTPAALMGDWIASTIDQNSADPCSSATHIEKEALSMLRELFGLGAHHQGSFVTGATMSNFVGLACGRQWVGRENDIDIAQEGLTTVPKIKVLSAAPHSSIYKALSMLGMGRSAVQKVDTSPNRESIDLNALEAALKEMKGQPCIVCANAGTVNSVDFDDIRGIVELREKYRFWLHVDGAFGGFAACSSTYSHLVNGWDDADSICIDAHKWLNIPYDSAIQLTRHPDLQVQVFGNASAPYLAADEEIGFVHKTPENSRRFRALPVWCTLMAYGRDGYRDIVERNCRVAQELGNWIDCQKTEFELLSPVRLNGVVFTLQSRPDMIVIRAYLDRLGRTGKLYLTPTIHFGVAAIRIGVVNWRSGVADIDIAKRALLEAL